MVYRKDPQKRRRNRWKSYLTYLVVASLVLTGVSMSRYETTVEGSDTARVATVAVGNSFSLQLGKDLKPGKTVEMPFTVSNQDLRTSKKNEVLMEYTLELEHSLNLPLQYTLYAVSTSGAAASSGTKLTEDSAVEITDLYQITRYTNTYTLVSYGAATASQHFVLVLEWPTDNGAAAYAASYSDEIDYATIRVNAVQKDS